MGQLVARAVPAVGTGAAILAGAPILTGATLYPVGRAQVLLAAVAAGSTIPTGAAIAPSTALFVAVHARRIRLREPVKK